MAKEGMYIYCIAGTNQERNFGPIGIGGRGDDVLTVAHENLSMVVSNCPAAKMAVSRENMLAHEKVVEEVMKEFTVLPVRFCTIAGGAGEIRNLLERRYKEFNNLLGDLDHAVELGVKALWKDMASIFREIVGENKDIAELKENIMSESDKRNIQGRMEAGRMVEAALAKKKETEAARILETLRRTSVDYKLNRTVRNEMFLNGSFLVDKGREKEFDNIMEDLSGEYQYRTRFKYAGPLPPYNFVNITIYPEEWEK